MGAPDKSQPNHNSSTQRVKVYRLNDDGKWDDQGTGHVTVDYVERSEDLGVFVFDEEDNETLLLHRICSDDIYRKQEDTIISWRDSEFSTELALSFQETAGCSYIWDQICSAQRNLHFNTLSNETFHRANSELRELPPVELSSLSLILKTVSGSGIADQMRLIEVILNDQDFFKKLMEVFRDCEKMQNIDGLQMIFKIVRGIILLNSPQIIEKIFGDELFMDIVGSLEFDPEVHNVQHHRNFLKEHVVFKEAIPIKDPLVLSRIHQTYRVGYLKDVILPRMLDEATIANLNSIIHSNNAIVVSLLKDDSTFIQELFARLRSPTTSAESKKNLIFFLHEFCSLSKSLQMVQQLRLYRDLINEGIFDIITDALQCSDKRLVLTGTDILILFLNQDPNLLRTYVVRQEGSPLLGLLVKGMITDFGDDMHCQFLEILRSLLDSFTLSGSQRDTIIELFYEKHLGELIDVITSSFFGEGSTQQMSNGVGSGERVDNMNSAKPEILSNICELLCFCVLHHPYRIKCNFLLNNVIGRVLFLTQRREKYLVVSSVRFVRTILSRHDENLTTHIVKHNLLKPVVDAFVANGNRYNLLNSAVLELFEYILKENLKPLVKYLVDSFWGELAKFENLASVHCLRVKYEQYLDSDASKSTGNIMAPRKRHDERGLDKEEEDYFNEDSDGEDTSSVSISNTHGIEPQTGLANGGTTTKPSLSNPRSGGLVDYDDEDDDEDYRPPLRTHLETSEIDEGIIGSIRVKRKTVFKEKLPGLIKKQRLGKNIKAKDSVFSALCSTLADIAPRTREEKTNLDEVTHTEEEFVNDRNSSDDNKSIAEECDKENGTVFSKPLSGCLHSMSANIEISPPMEGNENSDVEYREEETSCGKNGSDDMKSLEKETPTSRTLSDCLHNNIDDTDIPITTLAVNKNSDLENHREDEIAGDRDGSDETNNSAEDSHKDKEIAIFDSDNIDIVSTIEQSKNSDLENHQEVNCLHLNSEKRQSHGEECTLIPPNSSPDMAINGS